MERPLKTARAFAILAAVSALSAIVACKVYPDSLLDPDPNDKPGPLDGIEKVSGVGWWSSVAQNGCITAGQPTEAMRPAPSNQDTIAPIYFGLTKLLLGSQGRDGVVSENAWADYGFDLDGTCSLSPTCVEDLEVDPVSCKSRTTAVPYDGNYCRDNTFGRFEYYATTIPEVGNKYQLNDDTFNCGLCFGAYNLLVRVSNFNGEANDDSVRVDLYPSPGLEEPLPLECSTSNGKPPLCWLVSAPWLIDQDSMSTPSTDGELGEALLNDANAYVRDGYLYAQLPEQALLRFPNNNGNFKPFPLRVHKGFVAARIAKAADGTWSLSDGTIAGRVTADDLVLGFEQIGFCKDDPLYGMMTSYVRANLDIMSTGEIAPNQDCDAMSMAVGFTAQQATPGKLVPVEPLSTCPETAAGAAGSAGSQSSSTGSSGSAGSAP